MSDKDPKEIRIQKLPTMGKPLSIKGSRWRGNYVTTRLKKGYKKKMVRDIVEALKD